MYDFEEIGEKTLPVQKKYIKATVLLYGKNRT